MNTLSAIDVRWDVVDVLYSRLCISKCQNVDTDILEHAVTLALSPDRQASNAAFLQYDVFRNARHSIRRSLKRHLKLIEKISNAQYEVTLLDHQDPEKQFFSSEFKEFVFKKVSVRGNHLKACYVAMLEEESIADIALSLGVSQRTVNRYRDEVRSIVRSAILEWNA